MSCLVLLELVLGFLEVLFLEADLAPLLGGLGGVVALLILFQVELGQRHLDLGGDDVALALVALDLQLLLGGFDLGDGLLDLDILLGNVLVDLRRVELADDVTLLDLGPLGDEADDLDLSGVDLADAVDGDAAFEIAALGDGDPQRGLAHLR